MQRFINISLMVVLLSSVILWVGCSCPTMEKTGPVEALAEAVTSTEKPVPAESNGITVPDWFLNIPEDPHYIYSAATGSSESSQSAIEKARRHACLDLASQIETKVFRVATNDSRLLKYFREEIGTEEDSELLIMRVSASTVSSEVVSDVMRRAKVIKQVLKKGSNSLYRAYVLLAMPTRQETREGARSAMSIKEMVWKSSAVP